MTQDRCKHDMVTGTCSWCAGVRDTAVEALVAGGGVIGRPETPLATVDAEYRSRCASCGTWIEIGDEIMLHDVGWIHGHHAEWFR